ncbi:putative hydro-lyase [Halobacillus sp. ACCC02827]|uniref:putative hydro-lyase n=1 Tax=Halobacillus sp. ACCC02827 TaxID=3052090 RepID=UPI0025707B81|nr:putative hydro-lyase [Halobacillus sp. ACCC02827]WJE16536.1 putative hydro-lyase [Halobacillus sp. ACCC02827]
MEPSILSPSEAREMIREGSWKGPTAGMANGFVQGNLAVVPRELAFDFLVFCQRNPKPCPVLDVTDPGSFAPLLTAPGADLRKDLPKYHIYKDGVLSEVTTDITNAWTQDMVGFLLGCSFTFEQALLENNIPVRHIEENRNVPMYRTSIECVPAGNFHGPMVVSMRPMKQADAIRAVQVTSRFPNVHGAPVHIGDPGKIGIKDLISPDFGESVTIHRDEVPVFWACGVTPQAVAMQQKPDIMITHAPGHMFITDIKNESTAIL